MARCRLRFELNMPYIELSERSTMKPFNFLLAALPLLLLASCTTQTPQATLQDKKTELCTNLARLNTSIATLRSLSPNSTVGDFKNATEQVKTAYNNVKTSSAAVQEAKTAELDAAYTNLDKAISSVPANATLQQATQSVTPQVQAVQTARDQVNAGLQCPQ
jgi:uncharacterized phage infection (PIP) family protein YhgE